MANGITSGMVQPIDGFSSFFPKEKGRKGQKFFIQNHSSTAQRRPQNFKNVFEKLHSPQLFSENKLATTLSSGFFHAGLIPNGSSSGAPDMKDTSSFRSPYQQNNPSLRVSATQQNFRIKKMVVTETWQPGIGYQPVDPQRKIESFKRLPAEEYRAKEPGLSINYTGSKTTATLNGENALNGSKSVKKSLNHQAGTSARPSRDAKCETRMKTDEKQEEKREDLQASPQAKERKKIEQGINQEDFKMFDKFTGCSRTHGQPRTIDLYIFGKTIGKGSYASVRLALSKESGKKVAIKTYEKARLGEETRRKNIRRETEILMRANHPNIIKIHDFFNCETQVNPLSFVAQGSF